MTSAPPGSAAVPDRTHLAADGDVRAPGKFSGHLSLRAVAAPGGRTVLAAQSFRAPFHLSKPYWDSDTATLLVQIVNPTAGILAGDRLESDIDVEAGAALLVTTPSASRVFRMNAGSARARHRYAVAAGGWLEVMPEPLVPHRGSRYRQETCLDIAPGGAALYVDPWMPGRLAHGEAWAWDRLVLESTVRYGGELALRERLDTSGPELLALAKLAGAEACFANIVIVTPEAASLAEPAWRPAIDALHAGGTWVGVSRLRLGGWSVRLIAPGSIRLRAALREVRRILAAYFPRLACDPRKL